MTLDMWVRLSFLIGLVFLFCPTDALAADFPLNGDFENGLDSWSKYGSYFSVASTSAEVHDGQTAAQLMANTGSSGNTISKYIFQVGTASSSGNFRFSAWAKLLSGAANLYFSLTQCSDSACSSSSEINTKTSASSNNNAWENLTLDFSTAANTKSFKIKLVLDPLSNASTSAVWDQVTLASVAAPPAEIETTTVSDSASDPVFDFSVPNTAYIDSDFILSAKISSLKTGKYYIKARLGPDVSHLTHARNFNGTYLSDNDSWSKFTEITPGSDGTWKGEVKVKLPESEGSGTYKILLRIKNVDSSDIYDSQVKEISLENLSVYLPLLDPVMTEQKSVSTASAVEVASFSGEVLGTGSEAAEIVPSQRKLVSPSKKTVFQWDRLLISSGLFLVGFVATILARTRGKGI